jgi:hypothetical protein
MSIPGGRVDRLTLNLSGVRPAFGAPEFAKLLLRELQLAGDELPLRHACRGGQPRDVRVLSVSDGEEAGAVVTATAAVVFTELDGCGCGGEPAARSRIAFLRVTFHKAGGRATVEPVEDDPPEEL